MNSGYYPVYSKSQRRRVRHMFRAGLSMCGAFSIEETAQLEPERNRYRYYCALCLKVVETEQRLDLPPEPPLSDDEKDFIEQQWATHTAKQIAQMLGRENVKRVTYYAKRFGNTKQIPNAGLFQKGQVSHNSKPDVVEFVRKDKRGVPYVHVRGGKFGFQHKHVVVWEAANGPLPKGHCVTFRDGNTLNCDLSNLEVVTRTEMLERNSGRAALTDDYVAGLLSRNGKGAHDEELREAVKQVPELLEVKKSQLRLKRALKQAQANG